MELKPLLKAKKCVKTCSNILDQHLAFLERVYGRLQDTVFAEIYSEPKTDAFFAVDVLFVLQNTLKKLITRQNSSFSINGGHFD